MARKSITKSKSTSKPKVKKYQFAGSYNTSTYNNVVNPYYVDGTYAEQADMQANRLYGQAQQFGAYAAESNRKAEQEIKQRQKEEEQFLKEAKAESKAAKQQELLETTRNSYQTIGDLAKDIVKKRAADKLAEKAATSKAANIALKTGQQYGALPSVSPIITPPVVPPTAVGVPVPIEVGSQIVNTTPTWGEVANAGVDLSKNLTKADPGIGGSVAAGTPANMAAPAAAGVGIALNLAGAGIKYSGDDNDPTTFTKKEERRLRTGETFEKAGTGVSLGSAIGGAIVPGLGNLVGGAIGGLGGAGYGYLFSGKRKVEEAKQIAEGYQSEQARINKETSEDEAERKALLAKENAQLAQQYNTAFLNSRLSGLQTGFGYNTSTNMNMQPTSSFYGKTGGMLYNLGGYRVPGGHVVPIGDDAVEFIGNQHSEKKIDGVSGIRLDAKTEVENKETMKKNMKMANGGESDYFFSSDSKAMPVKGGKFLSYTGKSYADIHKAIERSNKPDYVKDIESRMLAKDQEATANKKGEKDRGPEQIAKYGGIHKYKMAGPEESAMAQSNMDASNVTLRDVNKANAKAPSDQQSVAPGKLTNNSGMIKQYVTGGPGDSNISMQEWNKMSKNDRYSLVYQLAKEAGDTMPEVTAAQWAIESGFGKSMTGAWNFFGQTTKGKDSTELDTPRDPGGGSKKFKNYKSLEDSIEDHVKRWAPKYKDAKNPEEALMMLQNYGGDGRYAQGYPTKEFPKGDWKAYVKSTNDIINQQKSILKTNKPGQRASESHFDANGNITEAGIAALQRDAQRQPSGAIQSTSSPIDYALVGAGQSIARGTGSLAGFVGGAARNIISNSTKPTPGTVTPGAGLIRMPQAGTGVTPFAPSGPNWVFWKPGIGGQVAAPGGKFPLMAPVKESVGKLPDVAKAKKAAEFVPTTDTDRENLGDVPLMAGKDAGSLPIKGKGLVDSNRTLEAAVVEKEKAKADAVAKKEDIETEKITAPRDKSINSALLVGMGQLLPLLYPAFKPYKPEGKLERMASVGNVGSTSIKGSVLGRVNENAARAAAERNTVALKNMIQNTNAGPGAISAMMAANTAQANQLNNIANQEQNANKQLAAEEARLGQQASMANAEMAQKANMANVQNRLAVNQANLEASMQEAKMRMLEKQYKREEIMGALDAAVTRAANVYADDKKYKAQERLANAMDDAGSYQRFQYYEDLKKQAKDPDSEFYGKTDTELKTYATKQYNEFVGNAKTGGTRKYTSRLGELSKGRKTFNI